VNDGEINVSNDTLWWMLRYATKRGRNGDDPQEVADDMLMDWQMTCAKVRVEMAQERGEQL
jgi:hypothetical protein